VAGHVARTVCSIAAGIVPANERQITAGGGPISMRFEGQVAIITGAARGIGEAIARRLASEGARVVIADIDETAAQAAATAIGDRVVAQRLDVTSPESWESAVGATLDRQGRIDALVNNAGIAGRSAAIWDLTVDEWRELLDIDLTGVFLGCRAVIPAMVAAGSGRIVNIASIAGKEGNPNAVPYSAAKAGVIGLTKAVAKEVATKGVLVNAVAPAEIETPILAQVSEEHIRYMTSRIPMGRVGKPEEVAALVAFLCSRELTFSTGAVYDISGGRATY
jgi:3-oxoacyl-[acyl-carrier protein] reductase